MRDERKIILLAVIAGLLFVILDTVIDPHFHEIPFFELLITAGSHHELFMRLTVVALMEALGVIGAIFILRRRKAEKEKERLITDLKDALTNVETLSGLLPICAYCKKVRDDKGYWNKIETYISKHSRAEFTHSICPECSRKITDDFNQTGH